MEESIEKQTLHSRTRLREQLFTMFLVCAIAGPDIYIRKIWKQRYSPHFDLLSTQSIYLSHFDLLLNKVTEYNEL